MSNKSDGWSETLWLGQQIRKLRKLRNLSLEEMSRAIDRSIGYVSQLERGKSQPGVNDIVRIAQVLEVSENMLFSPGPPADRGVVVRKANRRLMRYGPGMTDYLLSPNLAGAMQMQLTVLEPGADTGLDVFAHNGEEVAFILEGELELWVEDQHFHLVEGDSFGFESTLPHRYKNPGAGMTRLIWVYSPPSY